GTQLAGLVVVEPKAPGEADLAGRVAALAEDGHRVGERVGTRQVGWTEAEFAHAETLTARPSREPAEAQRARCLRTSSTGALRSRSTPRASQSSRGRSSTARATPLVPRSATPSPLAFFVHLPEPAASEG